MLCGVEQEINTKHQGCSYAW